MDRLVRRRFPCSQPAVESTDFAVARCSAEAADATAVSRLATELKSVVQAAASPLRPVMIVR